MLIVKNIGKKYLILLFAYHIETDILQLQF